MTAPKRINLALQGGGAHGAFTWGVLDRLLEAEDIEIAAMSGTSAGALNAAAFKAGMLTGGREGAKASLATLWEDVSGTGDWEENPWFSPFTSFANAASDALQSAMTISTQGLAAQLVSPYDWGPFWRNPLADVVERLDFAKVCAGEGPGLFVSATNVRTGKIRVFKGDEITPDVLLASACLPTVFQAVEFKDPATGREEAFWDGGYTGNPALFPLYAKDLPDDIVVVSINPLRREEVPKTAAEIQDRVAEIGFNTSLLAELRSINFVHRLLREGHMPEGAMKRVLVHFIADDPLMDSLSAHSKMTPTPELLARLKEAGRVAAGAFLKKHHKDLGAHSSIELAALFS